MKALFKVIILIGFVSCSSQTKMKTYEWLPTANAPKFYPSEIYEGNLFFEDGKYIYIPGGRAMTNGWGKDGPSHIVGSKLKPLPVRLEIKWFSYIEKKFYGGTFKLPREKIKEVFETGFTNRLGKRETYTKINVGLAPGGGITLWLTGGGWSKEIANFKASQIEVAIEDFKPDSGMNSQNEFDEYINLVLEELPEDAKIGLNKEPIVYNLWEIYRKKSNWNFNFIFNNGGELIDLYSEFINGERFFADGKNEIVTSTTEKALPKILRFEWKDKNGHENGAEIVFDQEEIQNAFNSIQQENDTEGITLQLEIDRFNSKATLSLTRGSANIILKRIKVKLYSI